MLECIDAIIVPYMTRKKQELNLSLDTPALCIFDVFASQRCDEFLHKLDENNIKYVFVPVGCTGQLQPLDVAVNEPFKAHLKELFSLWYAARVRDLLTDGQLVEEIKIDMPTSISLAS